ncbi:phosphate acetyltransferase [Actinocrinis puniceicyclus]|uniref:Phosphate acetyltransferase n=1 Tax=Actinocrinis puniceicyclus TaxID=977794 RepID=A0A8J7WW09_9ACTN|nr:phosphate acetyltransferase [Actinocrinis puniceicyclus]
MQAPPCKVVYVSGVGPDDGRRLVELGVMELLAHRAARVAIFRPLGRAGADPVVELLRARHNVATPRELSYGFSYEQAAVIRAKHGTDELVRLLVDRLHALCDQCEAVLVLGTDFSSGTIPDEPAFNARLANEFGAQLLAVVGGRGQQPDTLSADVWNAYRAYADQGCAVVAVIANRVPPEDQAALARSLADGCPAPAFVIPEEPALHAPTVAEAVHAAGGSVLLGDERGLARQVRGFVFGGALLPRFLTALGDGTLVISPGDRTDLLIGALAAHSAGSPAIAGVLLTLGQAPEEPILRLAGRIAPGLPVAVTQDDSFSTAVTLSALKGDLTTAGPRRIDAALGLFELHVDTAVLAQRIALGGRERITPMMFERTLLERARTPRLRDIVLPEGDQERILRAAEVLIRRAVCNLTLLGPEELIRRRVAELGLDLGLDLDHDGEHAARVRIIDPATSPLRERFAKVYARLRAHKGVTEAQALDIVYEPSYFGTLLVHEGLADGMVSGVAHSTAATLRPAFEIIGTAPGVSLASSVFFMCLPDRVLVYGDCAVNPDPDAGQLADIAVRSAQTAARFGIEPRVALLSYSTGASGSGADVEKVRKATEIVRALRPDLPVDGPVQYDAAVEPEVAATKAPGSPVAGHATVLVFPDLNTGNNTYKAVQRSAGAVAIGPIMQGLARPINDLSRGALIEDIVTTVAITAIQAQPSDAR